jgi:aminoglycoside phosphotransferase (APT) family kinase protein
MTEQQQQTETAKQAFEWPANEPPHPQNLALASQLYTTLMPGGPATTVVTTHLPSGWSSNDVVQVSTCSPTDQRRFTVKLPRHQVSSCIAANCKAEALRTNWASKHGFGPKVLAIDEESGGFAMEYIEGRTLTMEMMTDRLPQIVDLLRRIHGAEPFEGMKRYDPMEVVRENLSLVKERNAMRSDDIRLVESVIRNAEQQVIDHPWMPCHNDFHSHNVMLDNTERMLAIDFEDCDLGDPMWDLAYLTANLELELDPSSLEDLYGASGEDRRRVRAYVPLALAHYATWAALHGGVWTQHQEEVMGRLRKVVVDLD